MHYHQLYSKYSKLSPVNQQRTTLTSYALPPCNTTNVSLNTSLVFEDQDHPFIMYLM